MYKPQNKYEFKTLCSLLHGWYGAERAQQEIVNYCPETVSAGTAAENILKKLNLGDIALFGRIQNSWTELAGAQIAKVSNPLKIDKKVVYITVSHPAWLREFNKGPIKKLLVDKINKLCGRDFCRSIKFIPEGR
jgi:predicted nucleic acid-binding Zn ribbon protein